MDKGTGVAAAAAALKVPREQVLAFGDGNNDVTTLRWAGLGVAMADAQPAAKAAADLIGPASEPETALARAIHCVLQGAGLDGVCAR